ncbi:hypothetical protein HY522_02805 [bacterium]|nr:hypothetical protein [bacterium]
MSGQPSPRWDKTHLKKIQGAEKRLGRVVCGARLHRGAVCEWPPHKDSAAGRCLWHGGLSSGVAGNENAFKHGMYAKRVRPQEYAEAEEYAIAFVNRYGLDMNDPRARWILQNFVSKTMRVFRGYEYMAKKGEVIEGEVNPVLELIVRLCESCRRDLEMLGIGAASAPAPGGRPNVLDPATRDAMLLNLWNRAVEHGIRFEEIEKVASG